MPHHVDWVKSKFRKDCPVIDGYLFQLNKSVGDTSYYRCNDCRDVTAVFDLGGLRNVKGEHVSHLPDPNLTIKRNFKEELKQTIESQPTLSRRMVFDEARRKVTSEQRDEGREQEDIDLAISTFDKNRDTIRYNKSKHKPKEPTTRESIFLTGQWTKTIAGDDFILQNDGSADRIIIFGTRQLFNLLCQAEVVYIDGTFKSAPRPLFQQLTSTHFQYRGHFITGTVSLLPRQNKATYKRLLDLLKATAVSLGIEFNPNAILVDFESAMIEAIRECLSSTNVMGCLFHYSQCLFRNIQRLGLVDKYKVNEEFRRQFGRIKALPLLPLAEIDEAMDTITSSLQQMNSEAVDSFIDYVKLTWTGLSAIHGRDLWSHHTNQGPRTTNCVEGWHNKLNKRTVNHPSLYTLIELLKKLQDETEHDIRTINNGTKKKQRNPKYQALDLEIQRLKNLYEAGDILRSEFLDRVSNCLSDKKV